MGASGPERGEGAHASERSPERVVHEENERVHEVLRERARALAQPLEPPRAPGALEVLTFTLGRESCAVESRLVHAVFDLGELTPLPAAPPPMVGVTGWRGDVLTLLDVRGMLGMAGDGLDKLRRVIVLGEARPAFGVLAEEMGEVRALQQSELLPGAAAREGAQELVRGVTRTGLVLLDAERLIALQSDSKPT